MKVDQVRDNVNCRVDEVRYFVKIVDVVRVDQVRVDQVGCSHSRHDILNNDINIRVYKIKHNLLHKMVKMTKVSYKCLQLVFKVRILFYYQY